MRPGDFTGIASFLFPIPAAVKGIVPLKIEQIVNIIVIITLFEMMVTIGLGVPFGEVLNVARNKRLVIRTFLANYVCVPAITVGLLLLFRANPMVSAGFLIAAVCPGAPFGPPLTALAKGNVAASVGLMVILAGTSAIMAPVLLNFLLPIMSGDNSLKIDLAKIMITLFVVQLIPLFLGQWLRHARPELAIRLLKPAKKISMVLTLIILGLIITVQYPTLMEVRLRGWFGMTLLVCLSMMTGWLFGGPGRDNRKTMIIATSVRNVGVGLVIVTSSFPGTAAVTAVVAFGVFQVIFMVLYSIWIGRTGSLPDSVKQDIQPA